MSLYLTFDLGTTALKTALVDGADGGLVALHTEEYQHQIPRPGWAEMPPEVYWRAAVRGARAVLGEAGADHVRAIGLSSQGETFVPIDAAGKPLSNAIVWLDQRAAHIAKAWASDWLTNEVFRTTTGYPRIACELSSFKIAWCLQHLPEVRGARWFLCLPDYLVYRLTGECATDYSIALMSGMYDVRAQRWDARTLEAVGIDEDRLPTVHVPGTPVGAVLPSAAEEFGLRPGTPVCVGANDQLAGAVGAANVRPGVVTETTGTALAVVATTPTLLDSGDICVGRHPVPELSYALSYANNAAVVLRWLRDLCAPGVSYEALLREAESAPLGCDGLTLAPHFSGTAAPTFDPDARGVISGLTLGHTRSHLARAVAEGCACLLQECLEPVRRSGIVTTAVRSLGAAARSDWWLQMKADMLGVPVERPACLDAASVGAAAMAAASLDGAGDLAALAEVWYRPDRAFEPDAGHHERYQQVFGRYRDVCRRVYRR